MRHHLLLLHLCLAHYYHKKQIPRLKIRRTWMPRLPLLHLYLAHCCSHKKQKPRRKIRRTRMPRHCGTRPMYQTLKEERQDPTPSTPFRPLRLRPAHRTRQPRMPRMCRMYQTLKASHLCWLPFRESLAPTRTKSVSIGLIVLHSPLLKCKQFVLLWPTRTCMRRLCNWTQANVVQRTRSMWT